MSYSSSDFINDLTEEQRKEYTRFLHYQKIASDTLKALAGVCDKHGIRYYVTYGSLIGLVRHGGQIPWDYDIDVWVPMCEAQKLMDALDQDLASSYHYTTRFKDKKCRTFTLKLAPREFDCEILHVDVFWIGKAPDDPALRSNMKELGFKYYYLMMRKYIDNRKYLHHDSLALQFKYFIKRLPAKLYPAPLLDKKWLSLVGEEFDSAGLISDSFYVFNKSDLEPAMDLTAEDGFVYKVPADPDTILRGYYGDYTELPPMKDRVAEFTKFLGKV